MHFKKKLSTFIYENIGNSIDFFDEIVYFSLIINYINKLLKN